MIQKKLFVGDYNKNYDNGFHPSTYENFKIAVDFVNHKSQIGIIIPFPEKIKMTQEDFNRLVEYMGTLSNGYLLSISKEFGLSEDEMMILLLESDNDLHEFVDIDEPKHAYRTKKELESQLSAWGRIVPYLEIMDGTARWSSRPRKYTRSEFEKLPEAIQNLFEIEEEK